MGNTKLIEFVKELVPTVIFKAREKGSDQKMVLTLTPGQLKDKIADSQNLSERDKNRMMVERPANRTNEQCPQKIDEVMVMTSAKIEGDYLVHTIQINEGKIAMDVIKQNSPLLKEGIMSSFNSVMAARVCMFLALAEMGVKYR